MKECEWVRLLLTLQPAEWPPGERRRVDEHLATCAHCAATARAYAAQDRFLQAGPPAHLTPAQRRAFFARLEKERRQTMTRRKLSIVVGAVAGLAFLAAVVLGAYYVLQLRAVEPMGPNTPISTRSRVVPYPPIDSNPPVASIPPTLGGPESYPAPIPQPSLTLTATPKPTPVTSPTPSVEAVHSMHLSAWELGDD